MIPIVNIITSLCISFSLIILLPIGIILGIVFAVKSSGESDHLIKKKNKKRMWWSFLTPFIVIIFLLIISGLLNMIISTTSISSLKREIVMQKGEVITISLPLDTIKIIANEGYERKYLWDNQTCERTITLTPRFSRWYGSLGIYFPGPDFDKNKVCKNISGIMADEGHQNFQNEEEVKEWLSGKLNYWDEKSVPLRPSILPNNRIYNDSGLVITFDKYIPTKEQIDDTKNRYGYDATDHGRVTFGIWQIYINGEKPKKLDGSQNDKVQIINNYKDKAGLVYRDGIAFSLLPPNGWLMDSAAGQKLGLPVVFYKEKETWENAQSKMYATTISLKENTFDRAVQADIEEFKLNYKNIQITDGRDIIINDNSKAKIKLFSDPTNKLYEAVAYINGKDKAGIIIVLTSKTKDDFNSTFNLFEDLVKSYVF